MAPQQQQQLHRIHSSTFLFILTIIATSGVKRYESARVFTIINSCEETIWPAITSNNERQSNYDSRRGFELKPGQSSNFTVQNNWGGRIWGRTGCSFRTTLNGTCQTGGSCGISLDSCSSSKPPVTLAEISFAGASDFYDVSLVDGFNLPLVVIPVNGKGNCRTADCTSDLRLNCSSELELKTGEGKTIGCQSPCQVFKTNQYCCSSGAGKCEPTFYSKLFKEACPRAYSYPQDEISSTFTCSLGSDFFVNFCPSSISTETISSKCQGCVNSGGRCTYSETTVACTPGEVSSNRTVSVNVTEPSRNRSVNGEVPSSNKTVMGGIPLHNETTISGLPLGSKIMIGVFTGVGVFGGLILLFLLFICRKNQMKSKERITTSNPNVEQFLETYGCFSLQRYKYKDIKRMTNYFKYKLGQGGYGSVFKGKLVDGRLVAVKVLINDPKKGNGEEFMNEVGTIGRTNHINVVSLLGFCVSGSQRALVYEFMPNGSLEKFIYATKEKSTTATTSEITTATATIDVIHQLGWEKLYQIALGIARGLEYLHRGCNTGRILHFDIKPHNILLDEKFCPKISDFGLAKLCPTRESTVSMLGGRGTVGYIAPEVYCRNFGGVSYKSDVYSYGMMVLEMVGGRKNIDPFVDNTSEIYFPHWIYDHLEDQKDKIEDLLKFEEAIEEEMAKKMILVGLWCIQTNPSHRPSMGRVAEMLDGRIEDLQVPPKPIVDLSSQPPPPPPPPSSPLPPPPPPSTFSSSSSTSSSSSSSSPVS